MILLNEDEEREEDDDFEETELVDIALNELGEQLSICYKYVQNNLTYI